MRINEVAKGVFVFIFCIISLFLSACSKQQETTAVNNYGHSNAFNKINGTDITLNNNKASYYINGLSGDYKTAAQTAITKANASSSLITINTSSSSASNFIFYTYTNTDSRNGYNYYSCYTSSAKLYKSSIYLNENYLQDYTLNGKKCIAIHEMGHTLGLTDISASVMKGYTIMWFEYGASSTTFTDFQAFDIENITWKYGD